jgi:hypothetical protein
MIPRRALAEWNERAAREYGSGAVAHHFTLWLIQLGASPDLTRAGLDVVEDELRHAELCRALVAGAGGVPLPSLPREGLELPRRPDVALERDLLRACLGAFCLNETMAVTMFQQMRRICTVSQVHAMIDEFLADEVRHREFGWVTLEWLLTGPTGDALRPHVLAELRELIASRGAYFGDAAAIAAEPPPTPDDRAWGILGRGEYPEIFARTLARDVEPRLVRLGLSL